MKKLLFALVLISIFIAGTAFGGEYTKGMKYEIFTILGIQADHTYHCAHDWWHGTDCWSWTGGMAGGAGNSGGSYISYTYGYGDYGDAKCTSKNWGCRYIYAVQGVCHQEANRGLYTSGKNIARGNVGGYWLTGVVFGTYGEWSSWTVCKTACWLWW